VKSISNVGFDSGQAIQHKECLITSEVKERLSGYVPSVQPKAAVLTAAAKHRHSYVPETKPKLLRGSLTRFAHRFVPAAAKPAAAEQPPLTDHSFLPEAPENDKQVSGAHHSLRSCC
jgi:hypothetical protein